MVRSTRSKRILVIPSFFPSADSPLNGVFVQDQARALARHMEVSVLTPRFPSLPNLLSLRWGPQWLREKDQGIEICRIRKLKVPTLRCRIPFLRSPDNVFVFYRKYAEAIRRGFGWYVREHGMPDVIHAHVVLPGGWIALDLGRQYDLPVVLTEHSEPFAMHLGTPRQQTLVREILNGVDRCIAVSAVLAETMTRFDPQVRVDVIGNLIDTDYFTPARAAANPDQPYRFFFLGYLTARKGVQHLLEAIALLQAQGCNQFEVCIGGDGPYRGELERLATKLRVTQRCRFAGTLNRAEVRDQMRACDAFVLPSLGETFGVVLGEAMACGRPVLATRCGGPQEVVTEETGILVNPADARALAGAMAMFLKGYFHFDPDRIRASVVRRFSPEAFLEKIERLYDDAIGSHLARQKGKAA